MCGIAGLWDARTTSARGFDDTLRAMTGTLRHRGPDDQGTWSDTACGVGLGQTRLSIIDLSPLGHQPMISSCGRYVLVLNGEIYNFKEIRRDLETAGRQLRGHSDTEVLVEGISEWGLPYLLPQLNGMFAFVVWDQQDRTLMLVRDRQGIKPLYYGWQGNAFVFGSELKALTAFPGFARRLDRDAVGSLLSFNFVPAPETIWRDVYKLPAGHAMRLRAPDQRAAPEPYWCFETFLHTSSDARPDSGDELLEQLEPLLADAVKQQMVADVPLGAFLSGGVDSSLVVALMQRQSSRRIRTFTVGFEEAQFDERQNARAVAEVLGTEHTEMRVTAADALALIPQMPLVYDEPFADPSQIPTCLVSKLTRQHVTVSLSGDGGDELWAGYTHYFPTRQRWLRMRRVPLPLRVALAGLLPERLLAGAEWDKIRKLAQLLRAKDAGEYYLAAVARRVLPAPLIPGIVGPRRAWVRPQRLPKSWDPVDAMVFCDLHYYLPEDILAKVDRAAMFVALETRVPLLDHRVVEFSAAVPMALKTADGRGKWPLRKLLERYIPSHLVDRPKMGFRFPLSEWLRGPLREWADGLLSSTQLRADGIFEPGLVRRVWDQHTTGVRNCAPELWSILMYQAWAREWRPVA